MTAVRPIVASTAVSPSSSGMPAATRAPNAITRMTSVIGSENSPAFFRSLPKDSSSAALALVSPNCAT